jgi:hypothetical protein
MVTMAPALRQRASDNRESNFPEKASDTFSLNLLDAPLASSAHVQPTSTVAEPPWPSQEQETLSEWERFSRYPSAISAHVVAGLLNHEGVPTIVESLGFSTEFTNWTTIWVPKQLVHRARWVLAWDSPTEAELIFLSTGDFPREGD